MRRTERKIGRASWVSVLREGTAFTSPRETRIRGCNRVNVLPHAPMQRRSALTLYGSRLGPRRAPGRRPRPCAPRQCLVQVSDFQHPETADVLFGLCWTIGHRCDDRAGLCEQLARTGPKRLVVVDNEDARP